MAGAYATDGHKTTQNAMVTNKESVKMSCAGGAHALTHAHTFSVEGYVALWQITGNVRSKPGAQPCIAIRRKQGDDRLTPHRPLLLLLLLISLVILDTSWWKIYAFINAKT